MSPPYAVVVVVVFLVCPCSPQFTLKSGASVDTNSSKYVSKKIYNLFLLQMCFFSVLLSSLKKCITGNEGRREKGPQPDLSIYL